MTFDKSPLHVVIVGAGFGGAACAIACRTYGFKVTLLDAVREFQPLGDSIGFGTNTMLLFRSWGMEEDLRKVGSSIRTTTLRDFKGNVLGVDNKAVDFAAKMGLEGCLGHRGQLHMVFLDHVRKNGVDLRTGCTVVDYDADAPSVTLQSGEVIHGDVVICAEGVKSLGRKAVLGHYDHPIHSGYAALRAWMHDSSHLKEDPEIYEAFMKNGEYFQSKYTHLTTPNISFIGDSTTAWIGPDCHSFIIYTNGQLNTVLTHKDDNKLADIKEGWSVPGKKEDALKVIEGWDPLLRKVWSKMDNVIDYKLIFRPCLNKWVADSGRVVLIGDAAHPYLPTSTQGGAQAVEDAAVLARCLSKCEGDVPLALHTYFDLRYERAYKGQLSGLTLRDKWHGLHDKQTGRQLRDLDLSDGMLDSFWMWTLDVHKDVDMRWNMISAKVQAQLESAAGIAAAAKK